MGETATCVGEGVRVMCGACGGVGTVRNERLSEVLAVVVGHGGWMTTTEIAERTGLATTNTASLCARLRRLGHIVRRGQRGRVGYEWRAGDEAQLSADRARARAEGGAQVTEVSGEIVPVEDAAASELAELRAEVAALKAQLDEDGGDDDARHKFTAERGDGIIALITGGVGKERACRTMGITGRTLRRWRQYARAGQEPFVEYVERLEQAEATVMGFGAQSIFKAGQTKLRKPFCRHCETAVTTVTCQDCEAEVELRCDACNRKLVVEVPGDWRAMDRWLAKTFPNEWGDRINVDVQGQLRAFLLACRDEFEAEPEVFFRLMDVARRGAGPGVVPGDRGR